MLKVHWPLQAYLYRMIAVPPCNVPWMHPESGDIQLIPLSGREGTYRPALQWLTAAVGQQNISSSRLWLRLIVVLENGCLFCRLAGQNFDQKNMMHLLFSRRNYSAGLITLFFPDKVNVWRCTWILPHFQWSCTEEELVLRPYIFQEVFQSDSLPNQWAHCDWPLIKSKTSSNKFSLL